MLNSEEISADHIKSRLGGYKKKATREYLDNLRQEYDSLCKENIELKDKLSVLSEGVQYYKNMEKSLQKALVLAERTTSETIHAAEVKAQAMEKEAKSKAEVLTKEAQMKAATYERDAALKADSMIRDAKQQADTAIAQGNEELRRVHSQIMTLIQQYEQYKSQYKQLALAQMNVLESEAYTLEAPILKTIQGKLNEKEGENKKSRKNEEEHIGDNIVNPIPSGSSSMADQDEQTSENDQQEKKMYIDGRGELYEVHDFREVSISGNKKDAFDDLDLESNSVSDFEESESDEKQPDDYFKLFDTPDAKYTTEEEVKASTRDMTEEKSSHINQAEDSYAEMKRIEKMQLERLRREEEQYAELLKNQRMDYEYNTQNVEEEAVQANSYDDLSKQQQPNNEKDALLGMLHKEEEEPIHLSDLKQMEVGNQNEVSLPKTSEEEKDSFTEFPKEMKAISFGEGTEEQSSNSDSANKEPSYRLSSTNTYEKEEERNSLSYEMDHGSQFESNGRVKEGFKSFRDFESEL